MSIRDLAPSLTIRRSPAAALIYRVDLPHPAKAQASGMLASPADAARVASPAAFLLRGWGSVVVDMMDTHRLLRMSRDGPRLIAQSRTPSS